MNAAWRVIDTGGGCLAWIRDRDAAGWEGGGAYWMATDVAGGGVVPFPCEVIVGAYDDRTGEAVTVAQVRCESDLAPVDALLPGPNRDAPLTALIAAARDLLGEADDVLDGAVLQAERDRLLAALLPFDDVEV